MSYKQMTGNIISATKVEPDGVFGNSAASGVWNLQDQYDYVRGGNWPNAANSAPTGLFFRSQARPGADITKIIITTTGNGTDHGDLTNADYRNGAALGGATRWITAGGVVSTTYKTNMDYGTYSSSGTTGDFGDLSQARKDAAGVANSTRGLNISGNNGSNVNTIDYVTIASTGNSTDFGNTTGSGTMQQHSAHGSTTRALYMGGQGNVIEYLTIGTAGNATDFGNLLATETQGATVSSSTRLLYGGGNGSSYPGSNVIQYVTIASTGNMSDFGDLTSGRGRSGIGGWAVSSLIRGVFGGQTETNVIDYVTIASTGNATDFGDMQDGFFHIDGGAASNVHGGISQ